MTDRQLVDFIISKKRRPLSFADYSNFMLLLLPLLVALAGFEMIYAYCKRGGSTWLIVFGLAVIILGIYSAGYTIKWIKQSVSFYDVANNRGLGVDEIALLIKNNFKHSSVKVSKRAKQIIVNTTGTGYWQETVTIVLDGTTILINSRSNKAEQILTLTKNANNIAKLRLLLGG